MNHIHEANTDTDSPIVVREMAERVRQHFLALLAVLQTEKSCPVQERLRGVWRWIHWIGTHPRVRREMWNVHCPSYQKHFLFLAELPTTAITSWRSRCGTGMNTTRWRGITLSRSHRSQMGSDFWEVSLHHLMKRNIVSNNSCIWNEPKIWCSSTM